MGWQNPPIPWRELERRLSGRPAPATAVRPRPSAPAGRRRGLAGLVAQARGLPAAAAVRARPHRPVRRAARALLVQLPRRRQPRPKRWPRRRSGSASRRWPSPTTTACTASSASPRPPRRSGCRPSSGPNSPSTCAIPATQAERMVAARVGTPDPPGRHLLVLARDPTGYASLCRSDQHGPAARRRQGPSGLRPGRTDRRRRRALAGAHRLPQGPGASGARRRGSARSPSTRRGAPWPSWSTGSAATTSPSSSTHALDPLADERYDALAAAGRRGRPADRGHHGGALPRAGPPAAGDRTGRGPRPQQPGRDRRLAAGLGRAAPAQRRGDGRSGSPAGRARSSRPPRARRRAGLSAQADRAGAAAVPGPGRAYRDEPTCASWPTPARAERYGAGEAATTRARAYEHDRARAGDHRGAELPRLLPGRLGHRRSSAATHGILCQGRGQRGQLRGLLRPRDHRGRRRPLRA